MKKILFAAMMIMAVVLVAAGCGSTPAGGSGSAGLEGTTWALSSAEAEGISLSGEAMESVFGQITMEFKADGVVTMGALSETADGTFTISGSTVTVTVEGDPMELTMAGDEMSAEQDGATLIFTKQ